MEAFARVYTGWTYANADGSTPSAFNHTANYYTQMVAVESAHDGNPKTLLNGATLPAGQSAEQDFAAAPRRTYSIIPTCRRSSPSN